MIEFIFSTLSRIKIIAGLLLGYCFLFIPVFFVLGVLILILESIGILSHSYSDYSTYTAMAIYTIVYLYVAIDYLRDTDKYKSKRRAYDEKVYNEYLQSKEVLIEEKIPVESGYDDTNSEWLETRRRELAQGNNK